MGSRYDDDLFYCGGAIHNFIRKKMIRIGDYRTTSEDEESILGVLRSNCLSEGKYVKEFEEKWADFCGVKYCILTNSGTSALMCALGVLKEITNIRKVLTSPLTFISTINAIVLMDFEPIFSDVNKITFGIEPCFSDGIFLPVHLFGYPVDMEKFSYRWMIEDACQAHGSIYKGKRVGSLGIMGCFSFYIAHNIQVGDMGAVVTNNKAVYKDLQKIKAHGRMCECRVCGRYKGNCPYNESTFDPRFTHTRIAFNFKTTEMQAVLALNQLKYAEEIIKKRQENVKYLNDGLAGTEGLSLPVYDTNVSYLGYPLILTAPIDRRDFCKRLSKRKIENRPLFSCIPTQQPAYKYLKEKWEEKLPHAEYLGNRGLYVGCHQYLTKEDLDKMIEVIKECLKSQ